MKTQKHSGAAHLIIVTIILAIGLVGAVGYVAWDKLVNEPNSNSVAEDNSLSTNDEKKPIENINNDEVLDPYEGWKTYKTDQYNISFKYPSDWTVGNPKYINKDYPYVSRSVEIKNIHNDVVANLTLGVSGLGGVCGDILPTYSVLETEAVDIKSQKPVTLSFITMESNRYQGKYDVHYGLTDVYTKKGDFKGCMIYILYNSGITGIKGLENDYSINFGTSISSPPTFDSLQDAKEYLKSDEYVKVKKMIKSLTY